MVRPAEIDPWPALPYREWRETCEALHLWAQIVGKYRLAQTPWLNHSWHATLYVNSCGFTTSLVPDANGAVEIAFDLVDHVLRGTNVAGASARFALEPMSVAEIHTRFVRMLTELGASSPFSGVPNEIPDSVPFAHDRAARPYDAHAVTRFFRACASVKRVFSRFRTAYLGKASPVHLFWGSFDLAVTRFSGRRAPLHPGGVPGLPDEVTREAYSHEVSSAGFWPGGGGVEFPAFYSYAYPSPPGFAEARVEPAGTSFNHKLGEFILPYDAVRSSADPEATLMAFLESTYLAAAELGQWDRRALECPMGERRRPRPLSRTTPAAAR